MQHIPVCATTNVVAKGVKEQRSRTYLFRNAKVEGGMLANVRPDVLAPKQKLRDRASDEREDIVHLRIGDDISDFFVVQDQPQIQRDFVQKEEEGLMLHNTLLEALGVVVEAVLAYIPLDQASTVVCKINCSCDVRDVSWEGSLDEVALRWRALVVL